MKKNKFIGFVSVLALVSSLALTACGKKPEEEPEVKECTKICPTCQKCMDPNCTIEGHNQKCEGHEAPTPVAKKHLILDEVGDYGGTYSKSKYGEGAPLNGELDVENDVYYPTNDFYTMKSTDTRTIISGFAPYQQTMANSDGIACALMILNHEGKDVANTYSEVKLVNKYESLTKTTVFGNGTTAQGLVKLFKDCGINADSNKPTPANNKFNNVFKQYAEENKYMMVRWQSGLYAQWFVVIGYDTMNTENLWDDVIIFANPFDASDHYQDGYYVYQFSRFYHWWKDMGKVKDGNPVANQEMVIVEGTTKFDLSKDANDPVHNYPHVGAITMLLNKDGTIGGSYGDGRYTGEQHGYPGTPADQRKEIDHIEYNYYTFNEYTNMEDNDTRLICTGYRAYSQTMSSSCGLCSVMSVLEYYGFDWSTVGQYIKRTNFFGYDPIFQPTFGGVDPDDNGRKQEAIVMIYCQGDDYFADGSTVFYNYGGVGAGTLKKVPETLGYPVTFGRYYRNNFNPNNICYPTYESFLEFAKGHLEKDEPIVVSWNPMGGHFQVIMGLDDMGTESVYDDVLILGDSYDHVDHYEDGFNTLPAVTFYGTWYNGSGSTNQAHVVFTRKA